LSLKPIRRSRRKSSKWASLESGSWGTGYKRPSWNPSSRQLKALAIVFLIVAGVIGADQVSKVLYPNNPASGIQKYDPFTLLWNGTVTGPSNTIPAQSTIITQAAGGSSMGVDGLDLGGSPVRWGECWKAPISSFIYSFQISLKKAGSPTGLLSGGIQDPGANNPRSCDSIVGAFTKTSSNNFDASTLSTSFSLQTFNFSTTPYPIISGNFYNIVVNWATCAGCDANNYVTSEIASTAVATQNGIISESNGTDNNCASTLPSLASDSHCPTTFDLLFTVTGASPCPAGYQCLNSGITTGNNIQLSAKPAGPSILDSFSSLTFVGNLGSNNTDSTHSGSFFQGETFTFTGSWQISTVRFFFNQSAAWTGGIVAEIYPLTGTPGAGAFLTGGITPLAISQPMIGPFPQNAPATAQTFTFLSSPVLAPGSYFVTYTDNSTIASGAIFVTSSTNNPIHQGVDATFLAHNRFGGAKFQNGAWVGSGTTSASNFPFAVIGSAASAVAITNSPIDVSTCSAKECLFYETWHNATNLATTSPWGWYITTNATLPTQANYNPLNDPSVAMANVVYPNAGDTSKNYYEYLAKTGSSQNNAQGLLASSGTGTNPYPSCSQTSTLYMCAGTQTAAGTQFLSIMTTLNYTGNAGNINNNGLSLFCIDATPSSNPPASQFCSSATPVPNLSPCTSAGVQICATTTLPFLNMQSGPYYLGFWAQSGQNATINFGTSNTGAAAQRANSVWYWVPNPPAAVSPPATISEGGFFGPLIKALLGIGIWIASNILAFFPWLAGVLGPVLSQAFAILETFFVAVFNAVGNALGLGNVGTILQTLIGQFIIFFSSQVPTLFTNLPSVFSRFFDTLTIEFPWLPNALITAQNILLFGVKGIPFVITIVSFAFMFVSGAFATYLIAFWFIYTGDDSLAGILSLFETTEFLVFGIGIRYVAIAFNYAEDIITATIGLVPKPLVQMVAHKIPRLPIIEVNARFVWPGGSMSEIRNGNMFTVACWITGVLFLDMYETASPALPGSIGFLLPAAASGLAPMAGFIPLLEIMTAFVWGASFLTVPIGWFANALDMGSLPFESAVGTKVSGGFGGLRLTQGQKHFQSRLEKAIGKRAALSQENKQAQEATAKGLEI
jgi:hypothetical protein